MARVIGFVNAIMSGKLAGTVYARNKAGFYAREYVVPTNPRSTAQLAARAEFGQAVTAWHALTPAQKASWNNFALSHFKPKEGLVPGVTYSGQNAYVSLRNELGQAARRVAVNPSSSLTTPTFGAFSMIMNAPASNFSGNITVGAAVITPLITAGTYDKTSGTLDFDLDIRIGGSPAPSAPTFVDPVSGNGVGFLLFGSPVGQQQDGMFFPRESKLLAAFGQPSGTMGAPAPSVNISADISDPGYKSDYVVGETIRLSLFAVNVVTGQTQPLSSVTTQVV